MGTLRAARAVRTPVLEDRHDPDSEYVYLVPGDDLCSDCEEPIFIDEYPEEAPVIRLLANQKRRRGITRCEPCFSTVGPNE